MIYQNGRNFSTQVDSKKDTKKEVASKTFQLLPDQANININKASYIQLYSEKVG